MRNFLRVSTDIKIGYKKMNNIIINKDYLYEGKKQQQ